MSFKLNFSDTAKEQLKALKRDNGLEKKYKAVSKALVKLQTNPKNTGLQTHKFHARTGANGETMFEAYAENNTSGAYRIFWHYGSARGIIFIVWIIPHPK